MRIGAVSSIPLVERNDGRYSVTYEQENPLDGFHLLRNVGIILRAYVYMRMHGVKGIRENSINAVLNARYLRSLLEPLIPAAKSAENMHEFILTLKDESRFDGLTA